ncbi:protein ZGRF1 [Bombina bombina]|uniref:protein ZGRF1 n=1 Tax=Bombina bombina TaxID=8345 RepID=UPI00235A5956|nr:protein ZGRF1 [Bombina bombina]
MACQTFTVLYTHQKTKKAKVWQDGILKKSAEGNKATLYDDKGQRLDNVFLKVSKLNPGDDLESDRYLITVEAEDVGRSVSQEAVEIKEAQKLSKNVQKPIGLRPPTGLKRKFTGFHCPREVSKKPMLDLDDDARAQSPVLAQSCSSLPPKLYTTSPLFAAPCKMQQESNRPANCGNDSLKTRDSACSTSSSYLITQKAMDCEENKANSFTTSTNLQGVKVSQNIRSTAQILALLNPKNMVISEGTGKSKCGQQSENCISQVHKTPVADVAAKENTTSVNSHQIWKQSHETESVKSAPIKSRWDIYLDKPTASSTEDRDNGNKCVADESQCLFNPMDFTLNSSNELEDTKEGQCVFNNAIEVQDSKNPPNLLKRHLHKDQRLSNSPRLSAEQPVILANPFHKAGTVLQSALQNSGAEAIKSQETPQTSLKFLEEADVLSSSEICVLRKTNVNMSSSDSSFCNNLTSPQLYPNGHLNEDNSSTSEKPKYMYSSAECHIDELAPQIEGSGIAFAEISFNLMDSFDFADSDEDGTQGGERTERKMNYLSKRCLDLDEDKSEIIIPVNENISCKDSVSITACHLTDLASTTSDCTTPPMCNIRMSDQYTQKEDQIAGLQNSGLCKGVAVAHTEQCTTVNNLIKVCNDGINGAFQDDSEVISYSPKMSPLSDGTEQISDEDALLLDYSEEEVLGHIHRSQGDLKYSNASPLESFTNQDTVEESPAPNKVCDSFLEHGIQQSDKMSVCEKSNTHSPELPQSGSTIALLKTLTKHNTAFDSLSILNEKYITVSQEKKYAEPTSLHDPDEVPHRLSNRESCLQTPGPFQSATLLSSESILSTAVQSQFENELPCLQLTSTEMPSSTCLEEEEAFFEIRKDFQTLSDVIPPPLNSAGLSSLDHHLPQWTGDTQRSGCDWELSQWLFGETNRMKPQSQQQSPTLDIPFFLRPRNDNSMDNAGISPAGEGSSPVLQRPEEFNYAQASRVSRLKSKLERRVPLITTPQIPLLSNIEETCKYNSHNVNQDPEIGCKQSTNTCLIENTKNNSRSDISLDLIIHNTGSVLLQGHCHVDTHKRESKWLKYQSTSPKSLNTEEGNVTEDFCALSVFTKSLHKTELFENSELKAESAHLPFGHQKTKDDVSCLELLTKHLDTAITLPPLKKQSIHFRVKEDKAMSLCCELHFPSKEAVGLASIPKREIQIPTVLQSPAHYKQVFTAALTEHLNILMFDLSQRLHKAISKVDISFYTSHQGEDATYKENTAPFCLHHRPAKLVMVKKDGRNKGRFFYTCDASKAEQCKFFKWLDEVKSTNPAQGKLETKPAFADMKSLSSYIRSQKIGLFAESQLMIRKTCGFQKRQYGKFKKIVDAEFGSEPKTKLYLKLSRKESSSIYSKDDLWVVSKTLSFIPVESFIACSVFFGPTSNNEIEILPLNGYYPSNWPSNMIVHALLVCNASTELTCVKNIQEHFTVATLPIMPHLLRMYTETEKTKKVAKGKFKPPSLNVNIAQNYVLPSYNLTLGLAGQIIQQFCLNEDQATALTQIAEMMSAPEETPNQSTIPVTIIHGVFGAGKSYLLAVVVLFLVQLFENIDVSRDRHSSSWKLLISSSTNVAVDRVLLGLLDLGFDKFIRVGSIKKIAKPVLPYSLHSGSENDSEQLKELLALLKEDLMPVEKAYVRKSIEQHKLGTNKVLLGQVHVVGATCASCPFACLSNLKFPLVILDECSQMTEPASMLPIARFQCEKLILVGDPKQLSPTIQGSEAAHEKGLEQTLFNRLCLMGHKPVMLRTQYRCHPTISAIANYLFYEGQLLNGVSEEDRLPLLDWLPTLCFYNVNGTEQMEGNNSFLNVEEANFTIKLIQSLIASGVQGSVIGVITLYKSQMHTICRLLNSTDLCDPTEMKAVQVSTVDAFQGAEKEIIVLSCVRTRQVGFIDSEKRMNVALTRGKRHLLIVGRLVCLRKNKLWENVIHHCERQINGLNHISQWEEELNVILRQYQETKGEEDLKTQNKSATQKMSR